MKKTLVLFIFVLFLVSIFVQTSQAAQSPQTSQCEEYIKLAEEKLAPPYPNYFGAAGEYMHAADCYSELDETSLAALVDTYYEKAATLFVQAAELLVTGGDYYQRAKSYEFAGDAYLKIGDTDNAVKYYNLAKQVYEDKGYSGESSVVSGKITDIFRKPEGTGLWMWILGVLIAMVLVAYGIYVISRKRPSPTSPTAPKELPEKGGFKRIKREDHATPKYKWEESKKPEPSEPKPKRKSLTPKEKLAKKLREKYTPK